MMFSINRNCTISGTALDKMHSKQSLFRCVWTIVLLLEKSVSVVTNMSYTHDLRIYTTPKIRDSYCPSSSSVTEKDRWYGSNAFYGVSPCYGIGLCYVMVLVCGITFNCIIVLTCDMVLAHVMVLTHVMV